LRLKIDLTPLCGAHPQDPVTLRRQRGASIGRREGLHGAMKAAGNAMAPVSYSISRLARSTRDMLELASPSAGGAG